MKNKKLTIHKVAQVDRALSNAFGRGEQTRVNNAMLRGETFARPSSEASVHHHSYMSAWHRMTSLNIHTA